MVENSFRTSKDDDLVGMMPVRHWTDRKIRCHILTGIIAELLTAIEIRMQRENIKMSAATVMTNLHRLDSCLVWKPKQKAPMRIIEEPTKTQAQILKAFGYAVKTGGVLQKSA